MYVCVSAISCAISVAEMIVRNFATLIKATITGQPPATVDIAAEERSVIIALLVLQISFTLRVLECINILIYTLNIYT